MIEAFKLAAILNLEGNSFTKLKELMTLLKKTQREFSKLILSQKRLIPTCRSHVLTILSGVLIKA